MSLLGDRTLVFVVRIWQEPRELDEASPPGWRGSIESLQDGKRRYFTRLEDIPAFLAAYIQVNPSVTAEPSRARPLTDWFRRLTRRSQR